jgi:hypothetical protein
MHFGWSESNARKNDASQILNVPGFYTILEQSPQKYKIGVSLYMQDTYFLNTFFMKFDINLLLLSNSHNKSVLQPAQA